MKHKCHKQPPATATTQREKWV